MGVRRGGGVMVVAVLALLVAGLSLTGVSAQEAPAKGDGEKKAAELPATDPKARELLKAAWDRVESPASLEKDPLTRLASKAKTNVDPKAVGGGKYGGGGGASKIVIEKNLAWTRGNHFSMHVHDESKEDDPNSWASMGIKPALTRAITRIGHVMKYTIGFLPFDDEFKDCTFELVETKGKETKTVRVWRLVLNRPFSYLWEIDRKGKGLIVSVTGDSKVQTFTYTKGKKLQRVEKIVIAPEPKPEDAEKKDAKKDEKKEEKKDDKKDDGGGRGGRYGGRGGGGGPGAGGGDDEGDGTEEFTFSESKTVGGHDVWTKITSHFRWYGRKVPVVLTWYETFVNAEATDEMIRAGGFGESQGFPSPLDDVPGRRKDPEKKDAEEKEEEGKKNEEGGPKEGAGAKG